MIGKKEFRNYGEELLDKYFPKHKCKERGSAMVMFALLVIKFNEILENFEPKKTEDKPVERFVQSDEEARIE
jgi:hypothetical protein